MASPPSETALRVVLQDLTPITEITFSLSAARCVAPCTLTSVSVRADQTLREKNRSLSVSVLFIIDASDPKHHISCPNSDS